MLGPIGAPSLLLTTTGRKSGLPRTTPLIFWRQPGCLYVVGSNFGRGHHPAWSGNLLAEPRAVVTIGGVKVPVLARLTAGAERDQAWSAFEALARTYTAYRARTDREIRVFALEPS